MTNGCVIIINILIVSKFNYFVTAQYEGDPCRDGICKRLSKCPRADMMVHTHERHHYERCGFSGKEEIVCCPITATTTRTTTATTDNNGIMETTPTIEEKMKQVCDKIIEVSPLPLGNHILGGTVASPDEFPHMAGIGIGARGERTVDFSCGGTLISRRFVLTAAHCIKSRIGDPKIVRLGDINIKSEATPHRKDYNVSEFIVHPDYKKAIAKYNDIALLRLSEDVIFNEHIHPACLYTSFDDPLEELIVTGWGVTNVAKFTVSDNLLKASLMATPLSKCKIEHETYKIAGLPRGIINTQICAYDPNNKSDTCQGDSGGPLQLKRLVGSVYMVVGVTSFGAGCGAGSGVYTRVARYLNWIAPIVWP